MKKDQISCLKLENADGVEGRWRSVRDRADWTRTCCAVAGVSQMGDDNHVGLRRVPAGSVLV